MKSSFRHDEPHFLHAGERIPQPEGRSGDEAEPRVELLTPEEDHRDLVSFPGRGERGFHERRPDPSPLSRRQHADRTEREDRIRPDPRAAELHVSHDGAVLLRDEAERALETLNGSHDLGFLVPTERRAFDQEDLFRI